jgi:hypothetical protein
MQMIDWWTVRGEIWGVENLDFKVELHPVDDYMLVDLDGYTAVEQMALSEGHWRFVKVVVTPVGKDLIDHIYARQSRDGVAWGDLPDGRVDRDDVLDIAKELAVQAVIELDRGGFTLEVAEGSDFAPEKLTAPF